MFWAFISLGGGGATGMCIQLVTVRTLSLVVNGWALPTDIDDVMCQRAPKDRTHCSFSSLLPMKQLFRSQLSLPKLVFPPFESNEHLPKVLDLDGCFSRESSYHDHGDSLVWTVPQ